MTSRRKCRPRSVGTARWRRRSLWLFAVAFSLAAGIGLLAWAGSAYAGDTAGEGPVQYGSGQVGPGTGDDWRPLQTCWRATNQYQRDAVSGALPGTDLHWPFCHEVEDAAGKPRCSVDITIPMSPDDRSVNTFFSVFLGDYQRILRDTGANVISMGHPLAPDSARVYEKPFGDPSAPPLFNRFVPRDRPAADAGIPNIPEGDGYKNELDGHPYNHSLVFQSREQYIRDLYYGPSPLDGAWWLETDRFERVPAREAPRFFIRWQHPDHPMGGLSTDYAYVLQQQNYLNAQLLGNIRSYNTDGHRVIYKVQSKEAVLLHGQQVGNCGTPSGSVHPHPSTCTLTGTITSHRVVYPSTIALSYDYNPAPPRFGPTPTPFVTAAAPQNDPPVRVPSRGDYAAALEGTRPAPNLTPVFQRRPAFDAGLPRPVATNAPTAPPGFVGEQVHVPEYRYYDVSRVGTYDYPYYGLWGIPWEDFGVDYHRELMDHRHTALTRWASENLVDADFAQSVVGREQAWPNAPPPTVPWYLAGGDEMPTYTPTPQYEHASGYGFPEPGPPGVPKDPFGVDPATRLHGYGPERLAGGEQYFESHSARLPYPTPDQLIFSDGPARQVKNPFVIRDYPNTSLDAISIEMEMPRIYREDLLMNYAESSELLEVPVPVSRFGGEYAAPLFVPGYKVRSKLTTDRTDAIAGYQQFGIPVRAPASCDPQSDPAEECPYLNFSSNSSSAVRPELYDVRGYNLHPTYPGKLPFENLIEATYRYRWPVFFDDVSWYLFELHGVNKALADSKEFAAAVLDRNPFVDTTHYPAWALDPRMVGRPYDAVANPYGRGGPLGGANPPVPDIPHRYYGGGLSNYRNTVDPLEHIGSVKAMAGLVPNLGDDFPHGRYSSGNRDNLPSLTDLKDTDGYGMYTNRKVHWDSPKYAGFDGGNASYEAGDPGDSLYGPSRNHNLTFLPLRPAKGWEPGGTLVKRGVSSPVDDGSNSNLEWIVHDSSPLQVHGGHSLSTYQALGMPMPGSIQFAQWQSQWPDYPLDPNGTYLLATMYYEASFLSPFYIAKNPGQEYGAHGRGIEVVGRVPRMVIRPVFCRVLIQPLGVNTGPGGAVWNAIKGGWEALEAADRWTLDRVKDVGEKVSGTAEKVKEFVENLNPIVWVSSMLSKGIQGIAEKALTGVSAGGQMADHVAGGATVGDGAGTDDLDNPNSSGDRQSRNDAVDLGRAISVAQQVESNACPEGSADDGFCGVVPSMVMRIDYKGIRYVPVGVDDEAEFGVARGFYARPHHVDGRLIKGMGLATTPLNHGPLQFGYFTPGVNVPLPQIAGVSPLAPPLYADATLMSRPSDVFPGTRCPAEWELARMRRSGEPWSDAVQAHRVSSGAATLPSPHPDWDQYPIGVPGPQLDDNDVQRAYNDGFCAPVYVAVGCEAGLDGQCPGAVSGGPWASLGTATTRAPLVSIPLSWTAADSTSADMGPNFYEISVQSNSGLYGPVYFNSNMAGLPVVGGAPFDSTQYLMRDTATREVIYRVPANWREKVDVGDYEYVRVPYSGFRLGAMQASPINPSAARDSSSFDELCSADVPVVTGGSCNVGNYISAIRGVPTEVNDFGLDPHGLADPLADYPAFLNDLTTVYAMGPGASYSFKIRGVMVEATGDENFGLWSNVLTVEASTLCPFLDPLEAGYDDLKAGLGCDAGTEVIGAQVLSLATVSRGTPAGVDWVWRMVGSDVCTGFFDSTPARMTWGVDGVVRGWGMMWVVAMAVLVFLIFWQGIRMTYDMWMHGGWANQRDPGFREAVPRFFLALILAASSLLLCRLALILISNVSCYVAKSSGVGIWSLLLWFMVLAGAAIVAVVGKSMATAGMLFAGSGGTLAPVALAILVAALGLVIMIIGFFLTMFARVMLQLLIRLAMLAVLIVLSPLAFIMMATPDTEGWTKRWLSMFTTMAVTQTLQLVVLYLAVKVFNIGSVVAPGGIPMWTGLVVGIVILYLVGKIPEILDRYLGQAIVSGGSAPGMVNAGVQALGRGAEGTLSNPGVAERARRQLPGRLGSVNNPSAQGYQAPPP